MENCSRSSRARLKGRYSFSPGGPEAFERRLSNNQRTRAGQFFPARAGKVETKLLNYPGVRRGIADGRESGDRHSQPEK